MKTLETFVTEPESLNKGFMKIRENGIPEIFDQEYLEQIGFNKPNSILYVSLFKELGLVEDDGLPVSKHYDQFVKSEKDSRKLIAKRVRESYSRVFLRDGEAHTLSQKRVRKLFRQILGKEKSATIVYMVADTFAALASYADWDSLSSKSSAVQGEEKGSDVTITEEGTLDKAETPHEEFLLELMKGNQNHNYYRNEVTALADKREKEFRMNSRNGAANGNLNGNQTYHPENEEDVAVAERTKEEPVVDGDQPGREISNKSSGKENSTKLKIKSGYLRNALIKRAELLANMERPGDAISAYDDIIASTEDDPSIAEDDVMAAIYKKASLLEKMGKHEDAIQAYDDLIQRHQK